MCKDNKTIILDKVIHNLKDNNIPINDIELILTLLDKTLSEYKFYPKVSENRGIKNYRVRYKIYTAENGWLAGVKVVEAQSRKDAESLIKSMYPDCRITSAWLITNQ